MIKYEIIKNGLDDYILKYKDKEIRFHSKVGIVNELQSVNKKARLLMIKELAEQGMTVKDLETEIESNGRTTIDNSNRNFIEEAYIQEMQGKVFLEAINELLGMPFEALIKELEIKTEKDSEELTIKIGECLIPTNERTQ